MANVQDCDLPADALLIAYRERAYADCYVTEIPKPVSQAEYVEAFYTSWIFKIERTLLSWLLSRPSTDIQARALALGATGSFAAWRVEARNPEQLLVRDFRGQTRSWLMAVRGANDSSTRLYFGSAVIPVVDRRTGESRMGSVYRVLLGFHKIYSRVLLRAAAKRLM